MKITKLYVHNWRRGVSFTATCLRQRYSAHASPSSSCTSSSEYKTRLTASARTLKLITLQPNQIKHRLSRPLSTILQSYNFLRQQTTSLRASKVGVFLRKRLHACQKCGKRLVLSHSKSQKMPTLPQSNVRHVLNNDIRAMKISEYVQNPITRVWWEFQVNISSHNRDIVPQSLLFVICHIEVFPRITMMGGTSRVLG